MRRGPWTYDPETRTAAVAFQGGSLRISCDGPNKPATMQLRTSEPLGVGTTNPRRVALTVDGVSFDYDWDYQGSTATLSNLTVLPKLLDALSNGARASISPSTRLDTTVDLHFGLIRSKRAIEQLRAACKTSA